MTDFYDNDVIADTYTKEIVKLVKTQTHADYVAATNWMVRTSRDLSDTVEQEGDYTHNGGIQPVAGDVHVDINQNSSEMIAKRLYNEKFPDAPPYKRFVVLSLWRPFSPAPQDWPLAVCDASSVDDDEGTSNTLIVTDKAPTQEEMLGSIENEDNIIAASIFLHNSKHRWWYFSKMSKDELIAFKFFDSDKTRAWRVPHVAFNDPSFAEQAQKRDSIEYRTIAYFT